MEQKQLEQTLAVDWSEIHRLLEAAREALERGATPSFEEKRGILKVRAEALAREPERDKSSQGYLEIVEFLLAYERYGVESSYVREVYPLKEFTPLPFTPPFVLGIMNVRGQVLSVIDLKKFYDLPAKGLSDLNKVIIVHDDKMAFGILADAILGVRFVPLEEIQSPLPTLTGIREMYLKGVTRDRVVILDGGKLTSDKGIIVHEEVKGL